MRSHVGRPAAASLPTTRKSSRPGSSSPKRSERVGRERRAASLDLERRRLETVDVADGGLHERQSIGRARHRTGRRLLPWVVRNDEQQPVERELVAAR